MQRRRVHEGRSRWDCWIERLTDAELHVFFERLFPHGFASADVLADVAPDG